MPKQNKLNKTEVNKIKARLFLENINQQNQQKQVKILVTGDNFNYLINVLRLNILSRIIVFNGIEGSFLAEIDAIGKKSLELKIIANICQPQPLGNIMLAFCLIKNTRIEYIASKATELGIASFVPLISERTVVHSFNSDRFFANVKEASEQCGRNNLPTIQQPEKLTNFLAKNDDILLFCDERGGGKQAKLLLPTIDLGKKNIVILIGPEGGFTQQEHQIISAANNSFALNLGPRILRAETATITAISLVQEFLGDFNLTANTYAENY